MLSDHDTILQDIDDASCNVATASALPDRFLDANRFINSDARDVLVPKICDKITPHESTPSLGKRKRGEELEDVALPPDSNALRIYERPGVSLKSKQHALAAIEEQSSPALREYIDSAACKDSPCCSLGYRVLPSRCFSVLDLASERMYHDPERPGFT
ncbi:hypothetical protein BDV98DRAFT_90408 [Pterulicium gracile]|uniref:Uncharacterized protein n=1 Tax=Pterulicium gracile TaxID=1884261 RepID=A0A5C3QGA8_9AGAR|nr:hypothetical protein BDV98DRAFT_90408 [Pterula gracilis]